MRKEKTAPPKEGFAPLPSFGLVLLSFSSLLGGSAFTSSFGCGAAVLPSLGGAGSKKTKKQQNMMECLGRGPVANPETPKLNLNSET